MSALLPFFDQAADPESKPEKGKKPKKSSLLNDLDLENWREYEDIQTDSLWLIPERDRSGAHMADYHGNFVPQIPYQAMWRYSKEGDVVLDTFLGSGTTLIESRRLGRHGIGIELKPELAKQASDRIKDQDNPYGINTQVLTGDRSNLEETPPKIKGALEAMMSAVVTVASGTTQINGARV